MNSVSKRSSDSFGVSARPILHYLLTICTMILISDIYFVGHAYYCLSIWHSYYCPVDFIVNDKPLSQIDLIWYSVTGALFVNVIRHLPIALVAFAPAYLVASYVSRRRRIRHNLAGIIFWIVAWTMPCFVLLLVVGGNIWASGYPVFRYEDILAMFLFLMPGVCCGVVYCLLTFRRRAVAHGS